MAERILGVFPSSLFSIDDTEPIAVSLLLVDAKEDSEHLTWGTVIVPTRLVTSRTAGRGLGRHAVYGNDLQEAGCHWVASVGDALCLNQPKALRVVGGRTGSSCGGSP